MILEKKYFKMIFSNYTGFGQWETGDGINYNEPTDSRYTVEFITKTQFTSGVKNMPPIPKTKEQIIEEKKTEIALAACIEDGSLDSNGELK